jgi:hypothetical protein
MSTHANPLPLPATPVASPELETTLAAVEAQLASLGEALRESDMLAVDRHASELHRALAQAVHHFAHAARSGQVPGALRDRLMRASGLVASQRESLARATAALDRAMDVLIPRDTPASVYSSYGATERNTRISSGSLQA